MTLPQTRRKTFIRRASELSGADLNQIQDDAIELDDGKHTAEKLLLLCAAAGNLDPAKTDSVFFETYTVVNNGGAYAWPLILPVGAYLDDVAVHLSGGAFGGSVHLRRIDGATGSISIIASTSYSSGSGTPSFFPAHTMLSGYFYNLTVTPSLSNTSVYGAEVRYTRP